MHGVTDLRTFTWCIVQTMLPSIDAVNPSTGLSRPHIMWPLKIDGN